MDIGKDCFSITLHGIIMENTFKACEHPVSKYHNIQFVACLLYEMRRNRVIMLLRRIAHTDISHRWVYFGMTSRSLVPNPGGVEGG